MMKRVLFAAASLLMIISCGKNGPDLKPSVKWESNPKFSETEILENMDAKVDFAVPEGVAAFTVTVDVPSQFLIPVNNMVGISSNRGTSSKKAVLDLVGDATAVQALRSIGFLSVAGASIKDAQNLSLDFSKLVFAIIGTHADLLSNATKFGFKVDLKDARDNALSNQLRFNWTSIPEISVESGAKHFSLVKGTTEKLSLKLEANGKIGGVQLYFDGAADEGILSWIKKRNNGSAIIDLIETDASKAFNLPAPSYFKGKTTVSLDLTKLMTDFSYEVSPGASLSFCVKVTDQLGRYSEFPITLSVPVD